MSFDTKLARQIIPKSYHFDGYNERNCPNSRDKPFFSDNVIQLGEYYLTTRLENSNLLSLEFESVCPNGKITFKPYKVTIEDFIQMLRDTVEGECDFIHFYIEVEYSRLDQCSKELCAKYNNACEKLLHKKKSKVMAAVSFHKTDIEKVLASYYGVTKKNLKITSGGSIMNKNNFFGMNFELGMSKDPNITSTLMGVAVKNPKTGNWHVYDKANHAIKNMANIIMGNFPIFLLPTKAFEEGDLTKIDGVYYYVEEIKDGKMKLVDPTDGTIKEMLPRESIIPGMHIYTKVVAFDTSSLMDKSSNKSVGSNLLAAMCMMQWAKGDEEEFSLDNIGEDSYNGMGAFLPMLMATNGGEFGDMFGSSDMALPMIMSLGASGRQTDSMTQMLVISQLLGGDSSNNIFGMGNTNTGDVKKVMCEKCGKEYPAGTNFCSDCGGKTKSEEKTCKKCGATVKGDAKFCSKCGCSLVDITCPKCGAKVEGDAKFCSKCGYDLATPVEEESEKD